MHERNVTPTNDHLHDSLTGIFIYILIFSSLSPSSLRYRRFVLRKKAHQRYPFAVLNFLVHAVILPLNHHHDDIPHCERKHNNENTWSAQSERGRGDITAVRPTAVFTHRDPSNSNNLTRHTAGRTSLLLCHTSDKERTRERNLPTAGDIENLRESVTAEKTLHFTHLSYPGLAITTTTTTPPTTHKTTNRPSTHAHHHGPVQLLHPRRCGCAKHKHQQHHSAPTPK